MVYLLWIFEWSKMPWHFKTSQPSYNNVVTKTIIAECYVKVSPRNIFPRVKRFHFPPLDLDFWHFFGVSENKNPFLGNRDQCTSYWQGWADFGWSSDSNSHCNYMLSYELFPYYYDVRNSIFYKTSEISNWIITLKGLLYIHIQIDFCDSSASRFYSNYKAPPNIYGPLETSIVFRPWCNKKKK